MTEWINFSIWGFSGTNLDNLFLAFSFCACDLCYLSYCTVEDGEYLKFYPAHFWKGIFGFSQLSLTFAAFVK